MLGLFSLIFLTNISYSFSIEPDVFIQSTVSKAAKTLGGKYSKEERVEKLKKIRPKRREHIKNTYILSGSFR